MKRCSWVTDDPIYIEYHDMEWGVPVHDDTKLFEMLILEGAQAGLSWLTILKGRETYRVAYDSYDPVKIVKCTNGLLATCALILLIISVATSIDAIVANMLQNKDILGALAANTPMLYHNKINESN